MLLALSACVLMAVVEDDSPRYDQRWFYAATNLQVAANADRLVELIGQAARAGYNGVMLADYKFNILDRVPDFYFPNVKKVQKAAEEAGIAIIPAVCPIGYSNGLLAHDPNLAEGLPVQDAPFVVRGREAVPQPSGAALRNGDFEEADGDKLRGMGFQDGPGKSTFVDRTVKHRGSGSLRLAADGPDPNKRVSQPLSVRPHAVYRLSAWIRTDGLTVPNDFRLLAIGAGEPGRVLTFFEGGIAPTQDWKRVEVVFNSLDFDRVNLYAGIWGQGQGSAWVDEWTIEELGLVNVLRRPGCPLRIASEDGRTVYQEGKDYEPIADPKLGQVPYAGEYEFGHEAPRIRLTAGSRLKDGQKLRVSWFHPVLTHGTQIMVCPSEEKTYDLLRDQVRRVNELLHSRTFFLSHDEIRVLNWCAACQARKLTPGQILADNVRRCAQIVREVRPDAEVVVWSDMFDKHHNAVPSYYLVNGTLEGSWEGLPRDAIIANWNGGQKRPSLDFFAGRGHRQILAGYYDADDLSGFTGWDEAARGVPNVIGFMYTTWQAKYGLLDRYGQAIRKAR